VIGAVVVLPLAGSHVSSKRFAETAATTAPAAPAHQARLNGSVSALHDLLVPLRAASASYGAAIGTSDEGTARIALVGTLQAYDLGASKLVFTGQVERELATVVGDNQVLREALLIGVDQNGAAEAATAAYQALNQDLTAAS
jgi:hypothetical protein